MNLNNTLECISRNLIIHCQNLIIHSEFAIIHCENLIIHSPHLALPNWLSAMVGMHSTPDTASCAVQDCVPMAVNSLTLFSTVNHSFNWVKVWPGYDHIHHLQSLHRLTASVRQSNLAIIIAFQISMELLSYSDSANWRSLSPQTIPPNNCLSGTVQDGHSDGLLNLHWMSVWFRQHRLLMMMALERRPCSLSLSLDVDVDFADFGPKQHHKSIPNHPFHSRLRWMRAWSGLVWWLTSASLISSTWWRGQRLLIAANAWWRFKGFPWWEPMWSIAIWRCSSSTINQ